MQTTEITYPSHDGTSTVHATLWEPDDAVRPDFRPRAVVQLVHGMLEHVGRYERFARFLVGEGFVVCGNDHIGHGRTALSTSELGHMPIKGGEDVLVADVHELRRLVGERHPGVPHVIFGHSMGSFVTRVYLTRHGEGVCSAILCGTGQQPRILSVGGRAITALIGAVRGEHAYSGLVHALGDGAYSKIEGARTPLDWLATDPDVVDDFIQDPLCGETFTVGGYHTLSSLVADATDARLARKVPRELPMLFVAGAEDPVGDCGRGVDAAAAEYRSAGVAHVEERLYPGVRHEILNERAVRDQVMADVSDFLSRQGL